MPTDRIRTYIASHIVLNSEKSGDNLTPLKLVKLVYISHGYHLAFTDGVPLIHEPIEAWKYGPVVVSVYDAVKHFRNQPIAKSLFELYEEYKSQISDESQAIIDTVLDAYGRFDGVDLSAMTHQEGSPWHKTVKAEGLKAIIPNDLIQEYYVGRIR